MVYASQALESLRSAELNQDRRQYEINSKTKDGEETNSRGMRSNRRAGLFAGEEI